MNKALVLLVTITIVMIGGPADAAKHKHKHKHHKRHHHSRVHHTSRAASRPARPVATHAEYDRLRGGMTQAQVASLFGTGGRQTSHDPSAVFVQCPQSKFFCMTDDLQGSGVVHYGEAQHREYFTGYADRYDYRPGRACYSIQIDFLKEAGDVYRVQQYENWSNTCSTRENHI